MVAVQTPAFTGSKNPGQLGEGYGTMSGWEESSSPGILWEHFQGMQPVYPPVHPPNVLDKAWLVLDGEWGKRAIPILRSSNLLHPSVKLQGKEMPQICQAPSTDKVILNKMLIWALSHKNPPGNEGKIHTCTSKYGQLYNIKTVKEN